MNGTNFDFMKVFKHLSASLCLVLLFASCSLIDYGFNRHSSENDGEAVLRTGEDLFYYYGGQKIYLSERQDIIFVKLSGEQAGKDAFREKLRNGEYPFAYYNPGTGERNVAGDTFLLENFSPKGIDAQLKSLKSDPAVEFATKVLVYEGNFIGLSNEFYVKLKKATSKAELDELASKFDCEVFRREYFGEDVFFVKVDKSSETDALHLANIFYESGLFDYSEPGFYAFNAFDV